MHVRGTAALTAVMMIMTPLVCASIAQAQQPETPAHRHEAASEGLFPAREGSGTSWMPETTPMQGWHRDAGAWQIMAHGSLFGAVLYESGNRHRTGGLSSHEVSSANWGMMMARRPMGSGVFGVRTMLSAEPWTVADCGFINLLANGEMCEGDTIHDRQHPHDLFMELAADYRRPLREGMWLQLYGGFSGEPALGPPAFPHRPAAALNPIAPVTHHWLDSSHISFGVVTAAVYSARWKVEGSAFNAREPDEHRADLDLGRLDSIAGRLSFMPTPRIVMQVSAGRLESAEAEFPPQPRSDVNRATASFTYQGPPGGRATWSTTIAYGVNGGREIIPGEEVFLVTHAVLAETALTIDERDRWFGRVEVAGKPGHDLHVHEAPASVFPVGKIEGGFVRQFRGRWGILPGVGSVVSANLVGPALAPRYSGNVAWGIGAFIVLRPGQRP